MTRLLAFAALLVAAPAWASLPVTYDADYKTLKKEVAIGDPLGFELYETADCSGTPTYSEILGIGTPEVSVEQVKPVPAKKQKPKPPMIARLRATLDVAVVTGALYLRVQGDGIEPVGGECQVQVSAVVGAPGPEGPEGPEGPQGPTLGIFDANGSLLGIPVGSGVYNLDLGVTISRDTLLMLGRSDPDMLFELPGCEGQAYVETDHKVTNAMLGPYFPDGVSPAFFIVGTAPLSSVPVRSRVRSNPPNPCDDFGGVGYADAFPTTEYTGGLSFTLPAVEPLYVDMLPSPAP